MYVKCRLVFVSFFIWLSTQDSQVSICINLQKRKKRNFSEFILADHRKQLHFAEFIWSFRGKSPLINSLGWHFMSNKKQLSVSVHLVVYKIKIKLTKPT